MVPGKGGKKQGGARKGREKAGWCQEREGKSRVVPGKGGKKQSGARKGKGKAGCETQK